MTGMPLSLLTAIRFSRGRRRGGMVSLVSIISTLGIVLGVAVLIIGLSAMNGFERELRNRVLAVVPQGQIYAVQPPYQDWEYAYKAIRETKGVEAASPYIAFTGLLERGVNLKAIQIMGVSLEQQTKVSSLPNFVLDNAWQHFEAGKQQIILGNGVANTLNVKVGDWVTIMIPSLNDSMKIQQPKRIRVQVAGIFKLSGLLDHQLALIPLQDAQGYLEYGEGISGFEIKATDVFQADKIVYDAGLRTMHHVVVKSWINDYGYMYSDIQMIRSIMYLAMILVIGVACFNIVSTLVMAVKDKSTDIAVLRTLGAKDRQIRAIFLWYGLLSGLVGAVIGAILGSIIALNLTPIIKGIELLIGHSILSGDVYFIDFLPSELELLDVVYVLLTTVALSLLASWYPARRASKLDPARILSGQS